MNGLKHRKESAVDHFAGLDVWSRRPASALWMRWQIVREVKVASEPEALLAVLKNPAYHFKRIVGSRPLSQWLYSALAKQSYRWSG